MVEETGGFLAGVASNLDEMLWAGGYLTMTFVLTDIEGSTAMVQPLGAYARMPANHHRLDLGLHRLKGMGRPEQILRLQAEGLSAAFHCGRWATRRC